MSRAVISGMEAKIQAGGHGSEQEKAPKRRSDGRGIKASRIVSLCAQLVDHGRPVSSALPVSGYLKSFASTSDQTHRANLPITSSSHHSFASGCVWLDLAAFLEKNTGTFCV